MDNEVAYVGRLHIESHQREGPRCGHIVRHKNSGQIQNGTGWKRLGFGVFKRKLIEFYSLNHVCKIIRLYYYEIIWPYGLIFIFPLKMAKPKRSTKLNAKYAEDKKSFFN
jgi:hypothetical protein